MHRGHVAGFHDVEAVRFSDAAMDHLAYRTCRCCQLSHLVERQQVLVFRRPGDRRGVDPAGQSGRGSPGTRFRVARNRTLPRRLRAVEWPDPGRRLDVRARPQYAGSLQFEYRANEMNPGIFSDREVGRLRPAARVALLACLFLWFAGAPLRSQTESAGATDRKLISRVEPKYPPTLERLYIGGVVRLEVDIAPNG